jgi:excisionase family DNA binding protein
MLTVGEIAELLEVSVKTVRRWIASGELGAVRAGNGTERHVVRVPRASLAAFLEARRTG